MAVIRGERVTPDSFCTNQCKNALMSFFRFKRGYPYVATEFLNCDVVAANQREWLEVEVKVSWSDYCAEWKKNKHQEDGSGNVHKGEYAPNCKYFAAPPTLAQRISDDCAINHPEYGVLSIWAAEDAAILRKAKRLHTRPPEQEALYGIVARVTSELITLRRMLRGSTEVSEPCPS